MIHAPYCSPRTCGNRPETDLKTTFGFYWTEGRGGLGWAQDAVPTLKGGSTIGIASPPAIWVPGAMLDRRFVTPSVEDAEAMQGFMRGWTETGRNIKRGVRWKSLAMPLRRELRNGLRRASPHGGLNAEAVEWKPEGSWPTAAWGEAGKVHRVAVSEFPRHLPYEHLAEAVDLAQAAPLSDRALNGFRNRLLKGNLGRHPGFRDDVNGVALASMLSIA